MKILITILLAMSFSSFALACGEKDKTASKKKKNAMEVAQLETGAQNMSLPVEATKLKKSEKKQKKN